MRSNPNYKKKMEKLTADIKQVENTIAENQKKLAALKETKVSTENAEIISVIRSRNLSVDDIVELISDFNSDNSTAPQIRNDSGNNSVAKTIVKGTE